MSLSFFIARRLYSSPDNKAHISSLGVKIATIGVAIALAVMIVSVAVVVGFKNEIKNKVVGFGGSIQVLNSDALQSGQEIPVVASPDFIRRLKRVEGVAHVQAVSKKMGILKTDDEFQGLMFEGVGEIVSDKRGRPRDMGVDYDTSFIAAHIVEGRLPDFSDPASANDIVISRATQKALSLKCGEKVFAYFFDDDVRMRRYVVRGVYETNMMQFDNNLVLCSRKTVNSLMGWGAHDCTDLELAITDFSRLDDIADRVAEVKPSRPDRNGCYYGVYTIKELYGSIFDWLKLLDLNIWVILGLMICVCCFTMTSGLLILILDKTATIGILKALGARGGLVRRVFLHYGVFIVIRGLIWGNVIGLGLCFVQYKWHLMGLDATSYYVDHVPVAFDWTAIALLNVATLLICTIVLLGPTMVVSRIRPVKALRFD